MDRTTNAVNRQLAAFGTAKYQIGVRQSTGKMINQTWTGDVVIKSISWLKYMNRLDSDIYIRPCESHGFILIDDLTNEAIRRLNATGLQPALVLETSPDNYQVWIKLSEEPVEPKTREMAAKIAAKAFGGDLRSTDHAHYGRLAGFTNRKPSRILPNGMHPFVLLREWSGRVASNADRLLDRARREVAEAKAAVVPDHTVGVAGVGSAAGLPDPEAEYRSLLRRYPDPDLSRIDFMVAKSLAQKGYSVLQIVSAIMAYSPHIEDRKRGHVQDYADRTARRAFR